MNNHDYVTCKECVYSCYTRKSLDNKNNALGCNKFKNPWGWPTAVKDDDSCQFGKKLGD